MDDSSLMNVKVWYNNTLEHKACKKLQFDAFLFWMAQRIISIYADDV